MNLIVSGDRSITRDALQDRIRRAASGFAGMGIGAGDGVALLLRNDFVFVEASHAASLIGAYAVPINWHWKPEEMAYLLRDCDARAVVVHAELLPLLSEAPDGLPVLVVRTPPECAAAYDLTLDDGPFPGEEWEAWLMRYPPPGTIRPEPRARA